MADWKNMTKEQAAAYRVASMSSFDGVGPNDEHEFAHDQTEGPGYFGPDDDRMLTIVIDEDTGLAYAVTCVAKRAPAYDRDGGWG